MTHRRSRNPSVGNAQELLNLFLEELDRGTFACVPGADLDRIRRLRSSLEQDPLDVDCRFGPNTEKVTIMFQICRGLLVDGKIGPETWPELDRLRAGPSPPDEPAPLPEPAPPPTPAEPEEPSPEFFCGPDVTDEVISVLSSMETDFTSGLSSSEREENCDALISLSSGLYAWDIIELHNRAWIYSRYRPECATRGADPPCGQTVEVEDECYYGGSPNYVVFGKMCKLCHDELSGDAADDFTKSEMLGLIDLYKGPGILSDAAGNWQESRAWAEAGYDGWPSGGSPPAGDRSHCEPDCFLSFSGPDFRVRWCPHLDPATQCPEEEGR